MRPRFEVIWREPTLWIVRDNDQHLLDIVRFGPVAFVVIPVTVDGWISSVTVRSQVMIRANLRLARLEAAAA